MLRQSLTAFFDLSEYDGGTLISYFVVFRQTVASIRVVVTRRLNQIEIPPDFIVGEKIRNGRTPDRVVLQRQQLHVVRQQGSSCIWAVIGRIL